HQQRADPVIREPLPHLHEEKRRETARVAEERLVVRPLLEAGRRLVVGESRGLGLVENRLLCCHGDVRLEEKLDCLEQLARLFDACSKVRGRLFFQRWNHSRAVVILERMLAARIKYASGWWVRWRWRLTL